MSTVRQSKWDWISHWSRMEQLYGEGLSIPKISKEIRCKGFMPSQRAVYLYFSSRGYPTKPAERMVFLENRPAVSPADCGDTCNSFVDKHPQIKLPRRALAFQLKEGAAELLSNSQDQQLSMDHRRQTSSNSLDEDAPSNDFRTVANTLNREPDGPEPIWTETPPFSLHEDDSPASIPQAPLDGIFNQQANADLHFNQSRMGSFHDNIRRGIVQSQFGPSIDQLQGCERVGGYGSAVGLEGEGRNIRDENKVIFDDTYRVVKHHKKVVAHFSHASKSSSTPSRTSSPSRSHTSWHYKRSSNQSQSVGKRSSRGRIESGYYSGSASPYLPPVEFTSSPHPASLFEFRRLYRVACEDLHEPKDQYFEVQTCPRCCYSNIHNLGWSTRFLDLETFRAVLRSKRPEDLNITDAAGNSILHYAAASGAGYPYLEALIDADVDPYQSNTAGQLFLHWLRPYEANVDCFILDVLNLLNLLRPKSALRHADNDGQTVLHALAAHISDKSLRAQVFEFFCSNDYPRTILDRFGRTANDIFPLTYDATDALTDSASFYNLPIVEEHTESAQQLEISAISQWELQFLRDLNAQNIIHEAFKTNTDRVDDETGDTVFHALSRANTRLEFKSNDILNHLRHFVSKGYDTNRHNRVGEHPLTSFTGDRPSDGVETGATVAKYIDTLLWIDTGKRNKNTINVNMKNRRGATALYNAAIRGRPDPVRSLIEAGANVNARLDDDGSRTSILQATFDARDKAVLANDDVLVYKFKEVISHLTLAGAVPQPTSWQERCTPELLRLENH